MLSCEVSGKDAYILVLEGQRMLISRDSGRDRGDCINWVWG